MPLVQTYVPEWQKTGNGFQESPYSQRPPYTENLNRCFLGPGLPQGLSAAAGGLAEKERQGTIVPIAAVLPIYELGLGTGNRSVGTG